jgi:hypothetical protein
MARWQDADLAADWRFLVAEGWDLRRHTLDELPVEHWRLGSTRQGRGFSVGGGLARWLIDTQSPNLIRLLALGVKNRPHPSMDWLESV